MVVDKKVPQYVTIMTNTSTCTKSKKTFQIYRVDTVIQQLLNFFILYLVQSPNASRVDFEADI